MTLPLPLRLARATTLGALALGLLAGTALAEPRIDQSLKVAPGGLYEVAVSPSTKTVYVASTGKRGENNARVVALDAETLATKSSIDVSASPVFGLGINDETQTLYGTDTRGGALVVIDLKTGKVVTSIKAGEKAHVREAIVDPVTNRVYVSVFGMAARPAKGDRPAMEATNGQIWIVDGAANKIEHVIDNPGTGIGGLALDSEENRLYATDMSSHEVIAIDLLKREVAAKYPAGGDSPINIAIDAKADHLFVANQGSGELTVLNAKDGTLLKSVKTGEGALGVAFNAKTNQVYVSNRKAGTVSVVDATSYDVVSSLPTGTLPQTVAVDSSTGTVYVSNKARGVPRDAPKDTPPVEDPNGDTVSIIRP
jgi:YVTN family beta-propeller protein